MPRCATCPGTVKPYHYANGSRRCVTCRLNDPGRKIQIQVKATPSTQHRSPLAVGVTKPKADAPTSSWWMTPLTRAEFQAAARAHTYSGKRSDAVPMSPGGFRDV